MKMHEREAKSKICNITRVAWRKVWLRRRKSPSSR